MTTNKTPIQELIDYFEQLKVTAPTLRDQIFLDGVLSVINEHLQKEKAFAFDCFEAGIHAANMEIDYENGATDSGAFHSFYTKYAAQHKD